MKAKIKKVEYVKEYPARGGFGMLHLHKVTYGEDNRVGFYSSKSKDQQKFVEGQEMEFQEQERTKNGKIYYIIKPFYTQAGGAAGQVARQLNREQAKYSGFATAYVKDLIVAGKIPFEEGDIIDLMDVWKTLSKEMVDFMVELDKDIVS